MFNKIFTKYFRLSLIISLFSIFSTYSMEENDPGQQLRNQIDFDFDLLAILPREVLHEIMIILSDDSSFEGLRYCYKKLHKISTKELAELIVKKLYKQLLLEAEDINDLKNKVLAKHKTLDKSFPNYDLIQAVFTDCMHNKQNELDNSSNNSLSKFRSHIHQEDWNAFYAKFLKLEDKIQRLATNLNDEKNILSLKNMNLAIKDVNKKLIFDVIRHIVAKEITNSWSNRFLAVGGAIDLIAPIFTIPMLLFSDSQNTMIISILLLPVIAGSFICLIALKCFFIDPTTSKTTHLLTSLSNDIEKTLTELNKTNTPNKN